PMDIFSDLTNEQREAVTHIDGPLLVLAGAGSGKTRVITRRVAYLLGQGIPAWQVLAITFTNKAAEEMKDRTLKLLTPGAGGRPIVATFHGFCARMLREYGEMLGLDLRFIIYDTADRRAAIKRVLADLNLDAVHFNPDKMEGRVSRIKRRLVTPAEFAEDASEFIDRKLADIYAAYDEMLSENNALDFDDLLMRAALGLRDCPDFRSALQDRFRYLLIDEYQDTNHAQYVIARGIAEPQNNICATGDPDQSIYGWRGADLGNILDFEADFANAKVIRLEQNYRSTKSILAAASALIANNVGRKHKELWTENPDGKPVSIVETADEEEEANHVAGKLREFHSKDFAWRDMGVLYRANALTRSLEEAFRKGEPRIPYKIIRGQSFYERKEVRDVLAYLHVAVNPRDEISLRRIINVPPRGIGAKTVERLAEAAERNKITLLDAITRAAGDGSLPKRATLALAAFADLIKRVQEQVEGLVQPAVESVVDEAGFRKYLLADDKSGKEREANLDELINAAANYDLTADEPDLLGWLQTVSLMSEQDDYDESAGQVSLMTLHAVKGLEFPVVFIIGLEEGLLPHERSQESEEEIEEERRLFFVGMTRAKQELVITRARRRQIRGFYTVTVASPFLYELPAENVKWTRTGTRMGTGTGTKIVPA
ncbi:MAG: 3'-5' exonuclease, partial [Phycisphaerae bacterium]|nr:3'-5' exonuclease [Phycisphaerae bacterium]